MTAPAAIVAAALALPWVLAPLIVAWRARGSRRLDDEPAAAPDDAPLVSVIVPARNEARHIGACVRSILASTWPRLELIVVDDHSTDGTGDIARDVAPDDRRLSVLVPPPLPDGWFGKSWACAAGVERARGELLCFTDADTRHAPDLLTRAVHARRRTNATLLSVAGWQELGSFWERVVQPLVFAMLQARYGSSEHIRRSRRAADKIANGQFMLFERRGYEAAGGHAAVRDKVAEDLMLAQAVFRSGGVVDMAIGLDQLRTRMYASLAEIVAGWGKNVFAGGRDAMPWGQVGRMLFPLLLVTPPLFLLAPPVVLVVALLAGGDPSVVLWGAIATGATVLGWMALYREIREPLWYALLYPLGAAVFLGIALAALVRGNRVRWKEREYEAR